MEELSLVSDVTLESDSMESAELIVHRRLTNGLLSEPATVEWTTHKHRDNLFIGLELGYPRFNRKNKVSQYQSTNVNLQYTFYDAWTKKQNILPMYNKEGKGQN